jgi:hypothetical protein
MHEKVLSYDPVDKHPEILKHKRRHHTNADDFDGGKKNGKKDAAQDFNIDEGADTLGDSKTSLEDLEFAKKAQARRKAK